MPIRVSIKPMPSDQQDNAMRLKKSGLAVSGNIHYVDIFNKKRWITFNYIATGYVWHEAQFIPCKTGNDASEPEDGG
jgi:hypothetical protein